MANQQNSITKITIPRAIGVLVLLTLVLGTVSMTTTDSVRSTYQTLLDEEVEMTYASDNLEILLLQARRAEKDFMLRAELDKQGKAQGFISDMIPLINDIDTLTHRQDIKHELTLFEANRTLYINLFDEVATDMIARGGGIFGPDNGLVGAFRTSVSNIETTLEIMYNETVFDAAEYYELAYIMLMLRRAEKDYLLRLNSEKEVDSKIAEIPVRIEEFMTVFNSTSANSSMVSYYMTNWAAYQQNFDALVAMDIEIAEETAEFREAAHDMEDTLDILRAHIAEETATMIADAQSLVDQSQLLLGAILFFILAMAVLVSIYLVRKITNPIDTLGEEFKKLEEGDLESVLQFNRVPTAEIQFLGDAYINMKSQLRELVTTISNSNSTVATTAEELISSAEEVNASAEEVSSTSQAMSHGASTQTELINEVSDEIKRTTKLVDEIISSIRSNTTQVSQIALQTNILALNAGIEASRAGDYGRGFAVVAENIRKLSDQSKTASESITEVADEIASRLEDAFNKISSTMLNVVSISEETAASAEEVAAAAEEVTGSMEELSASTQTLTEQSMASSAQIAKFRL